MVLLKFPLCGSQGRKKSVQIIVELDLVLLGSRRRLWSWGQPSQARLMLLSRREQDCWQHSKLQFHLSHCPPY